MPVPLSALASVLDRTLFTDQGPIVKPPIPLLTGSNLLVVGPNQVQIPTISFDLSYTGKTVTISGTPNERNDGTFFISSILNPTTLVLSNASLDASDPVATLAQVLALANNIKLEFNSHIVNGGGPAPYVHGVTDPGDTVTVPDAIDLTTVCLLLNQILGNFLNHISLVGALPGVHLMADSADVILLPQATNLASAFYLANALRQAYENHRDNGIYHYLRDQTDRVTVPAAQVVFQSGNNIGPFNWVISDPQIGVVADSPGDVEVLVNNVEASIDAVFGLLGAVVLSNKPSLTDTVKVDYSYLSNPPTQFQRLNSPEFNLNQAGNQNFTGLPGHQYRARAALINPSNPTPTIISPVQPIQVGWKYAMYERAYTACLNDPNTLLLNVPTNRVFFPVLNDQVFEVVVRYDPTTLPDQATDPWTLEGQGTFSLAPGGAGLTIVDSNPSSGPGIEPPFYTHAIDLTFDSTVSAAFRVSINTSQYVQQLLPDGVFTGVAFGIADGQKVAIAGLLLTDANNLSSAIVMVNNTAAAYGNHLSQVGVHRPNDTIDEVGVVNASDLESLIILANNLATVFNQHISYGGGYIHLLADSADMITAPPATDLPSALILVNQLWTFYNAHLTAAGIHYNNDTFNSTGLVQQIGILTNSGYAEFGSSWNSSAVNWNEDATYRVFRDASGDVSLYTSGAVVPIASVTNANLPAASDVAIKLDPMSQVLFGSVWRQTTSTSKWSFIRVDVNPIDEDQIGDNKSVNYQPTVLPELDPVAPWITIGEAGIERITTAGISSNLVLDSTASAPLSEISELGMTTGAYRGFLRLEPILTRVASSAIQFTANVVYYTFSLDSKAAGVFLDDDTFSTWFVFLQDTPSAATVTGTTSAPFSIATNDTAIIALGMAEPFTIVFTSLATTTTEVITRINTVVGFPLASVSADNEIILTDEVLGANSQIRLIGGIALQKLGLALGTYFGSDSNPEPKVSWFGATTPNQDTPQWVASGMQTSAMLGRTMRITDDSTTDYLVYIINNPLYTTPAFNSSVDWKVDFRLTVQSFVAGAAILSGYSLFFAGALVNVDEGPSGKNVELQYAVDQFGGTYINVLSYNSVSGFLDQQAYYPFAWNDGNTHSINIFTNKTHGICMVLADNALLGTFSYTSLNSGVAGPALTFGSGATAAGNGDPSTAQSVVDWNSVCIFRDLKVADPTAASRRYVGIYNGGDPSLLASYYLYQIDWTTPHTYRITRDPATNVSVYVDGGNIPVISVNYDSLRLPLVGNSFLQPITENRECVAFGSFEPEEISRTMWGPIQYSIGKLTLTNRIVPNHQTSNQANVVVSPEHLKTQLPHQHAGFGAYSGGSPPTDFIENPSLPAYTVLGEGTPPVPMTQNLESRDGLVRTAVLQEAVDPLQFVDEAGFLTDLENDTTNTTLLFTPLVLDDAITICNSLLLAFNAHLTQYRVHLSNDPNDTVLAPPAIDLPSCILLLSALKSSFNAHRIAVVDDSNAPAHVLNDTVNVVLNAGIPLSGTATTTFRTTGVTFSVPQTIAQYTLLVFSSQPDAYYILANAVVASTSATILQNFLGSGESGQTVAYLPPLTGTVAVVTGSDIVTTSVSGLVSIGDTLQFLTQPGVYYTVQNVVGVTVTLTQPYSGQTNASTIYWDVGNLAVILAVSQALNIAYNAHLTQAGVHANSIFIQLSPPAEVVYEGAEFFQMPTGVPGQLAPYAETSVTGLMLGPSGTHGTVATAVLGVAQFTDIVAAAFTSANVGSYLVITGAFLPANNGTFEIVSFTSATQIGIANSAATSAGETNNGSISWVISETFSLV